MEIIIDVDGVLAETAKAVVRIVNNRFGTHFTKNDCVNWNQDFGVCTFNQIVVPAMENPAFVESLEPVPDARESVVKLYAEHTVIIATVIPYGSELARIRWLDKHGIKFHYFVNTLRLGKDQIRGDVLIDDNIENIATFSRERPAILFDQPWNRQFLTELRVYDWKDALRQIQLAPPWILWNISRRG